MNWLDTLKNKTIKWLGGYTADEMQRTLHENALKNAMERQIIKQERKFVTLTASVIIPYGALYEAEDCEGFTKMVFANELAKELIEHNIIEIMTENDPKNCEIKVEGSLMFASKE